MRHRYVLAFLALAGAALASPAAAQQLQGDAHGNYARGTQTKTDAWGAGAQIQANWGASSAPVKLGTSAGFDYTKQDVGPSQSSLSADVTLQPGGAASVVPYAGGSVSANWSGTDYKQWTGAKRGLETLAGLQFKSQALGALSLKVEERFGYVKSQEHQLTTRFGAIVSF